MYNGNQKKVIVIKNTNSRFFEEAYFILKESGKNENKSHESAMIREANRIANENFVCPLPDGKIKIKKMNSKTRFVIWFLSGSVFSSAVFSLILLFIR